MLDLTLSLSTGDSRKMVRPQMERSGSFHSSILNAGTSIPSPSVTPPSYIFSISKEFSNKSKHTIDQVYEDENVCSKTIQLFPTNSEIDVNDVRGESSVLQRNEGLDLNLTCGHGDRTTEPEILEYRPALQKNRRGRRKTSSQYRGVTFYRRTGRWESHIWDCGSGRQVYLGGFDTAPAAARAYDLAAIRFRGAEAYLNFDVDNYKEDVKYMHAFSKDEFVMHLRSRLNTSAVRSESGFVM